MKPDFETWKQLHNVQLNEQQEIAVQQQNGPVLLLAVPGSGKTTVLVARLGYLIQCCHVSPEKCLTVTYTVAATQDMRSRFEEKFGAEFANWMEFRTINGLCAWIVRHYEGTQNRQAFRLMNHIPTINRLISELYQKEMEEFPGESDIKGVKTLITYAKNQMLTEEELLELKLDGKPFAKLFHGYCDIFRQNQWMDYDDQMVYAYRILRKYPEILDYFQEKYHYISVDEAQDTSKIQHEIIRLLASKYQNLFMVGDEDQSIYGFRAAYPQALMEFQQVYPQGRVLLMEENYRSHKAIVQVANRFIQQNRNRYEKIIKTSAKQGVNVERLWVNGRQEQYQKLAEIAVSTEEETAILYRDNDSALPLIDMFSKENIPYLAKQVECVFFNHFIVRDILAIINFAFSPTNGDDFMRFYYKLGCNINKTSAQAAVCMGGDILGALQNMESTSLWVKNKIRNLQDQFRSMKQDTAQKAIHRIRTFMGYDAHLAERNVDTSRADILEALAADVKHPLELEAKLSQLRQVVEQGSAHREGVILSTIHSSKGLEYERVILMDVFDGNFPKETDDADALEEERRLFYVGMTRAKSQLQLVAYRKPGLESAFVQYLFPAKNYKSTNLPPLKKGGEDWERVAHGIKVGTKIHHSSFGDGTVTDRDQAIITVAFDGDMVTRFHVEVAAKSGCLTLI